MNNNRDAIVINKEIREYTESVFMGLNLRQCVFGILACIVAIGLYLLFSPKLGIEITSWICIIGAFPFAALGFITYQGMNAEQFIIKFRHSFLLLSIPRWRSHPIHENRASESICTEPCNPLLRATESMKRATSTY